MDLRRTSTPARRAVQAISNSVRISRVTAKKADLPEMQSHCCTYDQIRILAATFNVNDRMPPTIDSVRAWLSDINHHNFVPHLFAIGFQELDTSTAVFIGGETPREFEWALLCDSAIQPLGAYVELARVRLAGIYLLVFADRQLVEKRKIRLLQTSVVATGQWEMIGNKGAVGVSLRIGDTTLCLINSHLAAGESRQDVLSRNNHHRSITTRIYFKHVKASYPRQIDDHDAIIWLGDLNYRIAIVEGTLNNAEFSHARHDNELVRHHASRANFDWLLGFDELKQMQRSCHAFASYSEPEITFPPTYKYDAGTSNWDSSDKQRAPAYTDRVLYRAVRTQIAPLFYESIPHVFFSDHKPVRAGLELRVKTMRPLSASY